MSGILTTVVQPDVTVSDVDIRVTYIEVERNHGTTASYAKVKGIVENPEALELGQTVTVMLNDEVLFRGDLNKAVQDGSGVVTVEAYDVIQSLHNQYVRISTEVGQFASSVARDLLSDSTVEDYFVAEQGSFPGNETRSLYQYGSKNSGERLSSVLDDLATKLGAVIWATKDNQVRIEPYPEHREYELQYITEMKAGGESVSNKNVLVKGGSPVSDLGQAAAHVKRQIDLSSSGQLPSPGEETETDAPQKVMRDDNVGTQEEADRAALSLARDEIRSTTPGTVTVVGNGSVELFDEVIIPDAEYTYNTGVNPARVPGNAVATSNVYYIKNITHKLTADNGYLTTLDVAPSEKNALNELSGPAGAIADELTRDIERGTASREPLGITEGFGS